MIIASHDNIYRNTDFASKYGKVGNYPLIIYRMMIWNCSTVKKAGGGLKKVTVSGFRLQSTVK